MAYDGAMLPDNPVSNVLDNYTACCRGVQTIGRVSGGFSGSSIWQITAESGLFCLRRWPADHPDQARLTLIHQVLRNVADQGLPFVPAPHQTNGGATFSEYDGAFWELSPWLPGVADFHERPTPKRLRSAMQALAAFHIAARNGVGEGYAIAPSFTDRVGLATQFLGGGIERIAIAVRRRVASVSVLRPLDSLATQAFPLACKMLPRLLPPLRAAAASPLPLQPAIRDIHHDHVLFTEEHLTGIVDFGALRIDTPLADVGRLLGSLVEDDAKRRDEALEAYGSLLPLGDEERRLVDLLDRSGVVLGTLNWLDWLYVEQRQFDAETAVTARLQTLIRRLQAERPGSAT